MRLGIFRPRPQPLSDAQRLHLGHRGGRVGTASERCPPAPACSTSAAARAARASFCAECGFDVTGVDIAGPGSPRPRA